MKKYCINKIDDIFRFKFLIEDTLSETKELDKPYELSDFIVKYMDISKCTYLTNNMILPFKLYNFKNEVILIYSDEENINLLENKLAAINYNLSNLKPISKMMIMQNLDPNLDMFIINNNYYV